MSDPVFSLTSPLVSLTYRNLTAYLSVNSQPGPGYGKFTMLTVPANAGLAGPGQVQNELDSNATISKEHSLLNQGGSKVIKGNLLTVPIAGSMLYVEPWYVQGSGGQTFPVLRKFLAYSRPSQGSRPRHRPPRRNCEQRSGRHRSTRPPPSKRCATATSRSTGGARRR
jgi:uncharacterized membrane protein (UPF0182 family)